MLFEIEFVIIIYYEICSILYYFFYKHFFCYLKPKIIWVSGVPMVPLLFTIKESGLYYNFPNESQNCHH